MMSIFPWNRLMMYQIFIPKEKREIKPLLLKFSAALAFSFAGYLLSRAYARWSGSTSLPPRPSDNDCEVDKKQSGRQNHSEKAIRQEESQAPRLPIEDGFSPNSWDTGDKNAYLEPEYDYSDGFSPRLVVESPRMETSTPKAYRSYEREEYEEEVKRLRNMVRMLRDRERNLELQLLEYYGLKEQETTIMELQNRLKLNNMEAKLFTIKIETLHAENRRLEAQVADHARVAGELETARAKIKTLRKKLRHEAEKNKEKILALQKRVEILQEQDQKADANASSGEQNVDANLKKRVHELEDEADELRKSNKKLQLKNSDLIRRLESTQILATSVLEDQAGQELREVSLMLKQKNEELAKEIDQLQTDRCADVEELVYLRWINACLRYELRNVQAQPGKTVARDLSKTLSPKSEAKAKQLIFEYANSEGLDADRGIDFDSEWSSSHASMVIDCETEDSPRGEAETPVGARSHYPHKAKFFGKLRRLITGKDRHHRQIISEQSTPLTDPMQLGSDSDNSPCYASSTSTRTTFKTSERSHRFATPFRTLSLDIQSRSSLNLDDVKEMDRRRMSSEAGSSSTRSYRRYSNIRGSISDLSEHDIDSSRKSELVKYAEALKESRSSTPRVLEKS